MIVTLFTSPSCTSCRKAKAWLEEHEIPYTERNIFSEPLSISEIKKFYGWQRMVQMKLFQRVRRFSKIKCRCWKLTIATFIWINSRISRPITPSHYFRWKRLQVGYNEDEIRRFLPRKVRAYQLQEAQRMVN